MSNFQIPKFLVHFYNKEFVRLFALPFTVLVLAFVLWPIKLPEYDYSTVINDSKGGLLSASVAKDDQWRFPKPDSIPNKIETSILHFEDEYFHWHPGINPVSLIRAARQNIKGGRIISGASTITMQIARMIGNNDRTIGNKMKEMLVALKLELKYSKKELLIIYASMAPFGGNVVGIESASWRYYGRGPHMLSWAESATLAVLPNLPGAIFPGSQDSLLIQKRNRLLSKLLENKAIDSMTFELAILEPIPLSPLPIPSHASHLLTTYSQLNEGKRLKTTLDPYWQTRVSSLVENHHLSMKSNGVENLSALVVDLSDGRVLAYKGNTNDLSADGNQVDIIQRPRSPGSSLKPLLFASALDQGLILRKTMLPDIPSFFGGFSPKNFNHGYSGAVNANQALSRSLNIPLVHLLHQYSYEQFYTDLKDWGITTLHESAGHYGLTLILGGCEVTPWELAQLYFSFYRKMAGERNLSIHYGSDLIERPNISLGQDAIWQTFQTMTSLARPEGEKAWRTFSSSQVISWKTGTSHGFRDAWALGMNGSVLVVVWVGNADGEGRADLTGIKAAAPLLHSIIKLSKGNDGWLETLKPSMKERNVCSLSGMLANEECPTEIQQVTQNADKSGLCQFHKNFVMDKSGQFRVNSDCYSLTESIKKTFFVLPSIQGHYYGQENPNYTGLPPVWSSCAGKTNPIDVIYPNNRSRVFIPKEISGNRGRTVLQASHQVTGAEIYWHVDKVYLGKTAEDHQLAVWLESGMHVLTLVDTEGNFISRSFEVVSGDP